MTITLTREEAQQVLDALEEAQDYTSCPAHSPSMTRQCAVAAVALRAQLAQPEPEPVVWAAFDEYGDIIDLINAPDSGYAPLYTAPPQRKWQGLTDEDIREMWGSYFSRGIDFARAIEAKLKEKNA